MTRCVNMMAPVRKRTTYATIRKRCFNYNRLYILVIFPKFNLPLCYRNGYDPVCGVDAIIDNIIK